MNISKEEALAVIAEAAKAEAKIVKIRKKKHSDFLEIKKMIRELGKLSCSGRPGDQAYDLYKKIQSLWMKGLPKTFSYIDTLYYGFYSEEERLSKSERELLNVFRELDIWHSGELQLAFRKNFKDTAKKIIASLKKNPESISEFVRKMYKRDSDNAISALFALMYANEYEPSQLCKILKSLCEILNIPNKLDCVNLECLQVDDDSSEPIEDAIKSYKVRQENRDLFYKQRDYVVEQVGLCIEKKDLNDAQIKGLFSVCEKVFVRPYKFDDVSDVLQDIHFIEILPMAVRYDVLG
jgi:hypothetical protein